jgi:hypothetical protein
MSTVPVYVKTPKGIAEMNERGQGLSPRERRILIMADGKRDADEITAMFPNDEVNLLFANLLEKGYLTPLHVQPAPKDAASAAIAPPVDDAQRFLMAKNLMSNTVRMMLGSMGSGLLNRIEKCSNLDELRLIFQAWREAILMTKEGRKQGAELESRVAALLS